MAAIFVASGMAVPDGPAGLLPDKLVHAVIYGGLGLLTLRALTGRLRAPVRWTRAVWAVAIASAYGVTDEMHQAFVPSRDADVLDVFADVAGASVAVAVAVWWGRRAAPPRGRAATGRPKP